MGVPAGDLVWLAAAVLAAGIVTGILAGLFGIGGGAVIVPVLFEVFRVTGVPEEVRMQLCIGTSLAIIVPTSLRSYRAHRARGLVIPYVLQSWAMPAIVGVAVGSLAAAIAPAGLFKAAFALIAGIIAAKLLFGREGRVVGSDLPGRALMAGCGFGVGLASSRMGISGGRTREDGGGREGSGARIASAGPLAVGAPGGPDQAKVPRLQIGSDPRIGVVVIAPVSGDAARSGARLAHRLPRRWLEIGF